MSVKSRLSELAALMRVEPDHVPEPVVQRVEFPCGVPDCLIEPTEMERDEKYIVVGCSDHDAQTRWDLVKRDVAPLNIIKPAWKPYGTGVR